MTVAIKAPWQIRHEKYRQMTQYEPINASGSTACDSHSVFAYQWGWRIHSWSVFFLILSNVVLKKLRRFWLDFTTDVQQNHFINSLLYAQRRLKAIAHDCQMTENIHPHSPASCHAGVTCPRNSRALNRVLFLVKVEGKRCVALWLNMKLKACKCVSDATLGHLNVKYGQ